MKFLILILLFSIMPIGLIGQEGVSPDGKTFRATRKVSFSTGVKEGLKVDKGFQFIELGIFNTGGDEKGYSELDAIYFGITGTNSSEVDIAVKVTIEEKEIRLVDGALEAQLNTMWVHVPCDQQAQEGTMTTYSCHYYLSSSGYRSFRFFPLVVVASGGHITTGETTLLIVQISCEYTDL
jgi:hypothetical protein